MTTRVTLTGTGNPAVHPDRAGPGALVVYGDTSLQFDVGRATTMRLAALGIPPNRLTAVFLTHHHSDHAVGLTDLVHSRWIHAQQQDAALPVVAPSGPIDSVLDRLMLPWEADVAVRRQHRGGDEPRVRRLSFEAEAKPTEVFAIGDVSVLSILVEHDPVVPAVAYRVNTPDGSVVISGDTRVCDGIEILAPGADVLVHEVMLNRGIRAANGNPVTRYHADAIELGRQAARLGVPTLMLTHLIPAPDSPELHEAYVEEIRQGGYEGTVIVGADLSSVALQGQA